MGIEQSITDELHKIEAAFSAHFGALSAPAISIDAKAALESLRRLITQIEAGLMPSHSSTLGPFEPGMGAKGVPTPLAEPKVQTPPAKPAPPKPTGAK